MAVQVNSQLSPGARATGLNVATTSAPTTGSSTGTKVAVAGAAIVGGLTLTTILVSAVAGWTIQRTLDKAWDGIRGKKSRR